MSHWPHSHTFLRAIERAQRVALQRFGLIQVGEVYGEQIDLDAARAHLRVDLFGSPPESDDDDWIDAQIPAAREYCENYIARALAPRTMELASNEFPRHYETSPPGPAIRLPFGPVQSVTSVTYIDGDGDLQTMSPSDYELDAYVVPARLILAYGATWPAARNQQNSVKVRYVAGYSLPTDSPIAYALPKLARSAMLLMLGHLYANREAVVVDTRAVAVELPLGVTSLLDLMPDIEGLGLA